MPAKFRAVAAAKVNLNEDERPYLFTNIIDIKVQGLLDSGAQSSIMNGNTYRKMKEKGLGLKYCNVVITTADGTGHNGRLCGRTVCC